MPQRTLVTIDPDYHTSENFREQMCVLYDSNIPSKDSDSILAYRSHFLTCQPGMAGFDVQFPGHETLDGWNSLDHLIEEDNILGTFHTHPPGTDFSNQDYRAIIGLAMANGSRLIWHGIQPLKSEDAHYLCANMINGGQVVIHDLGWVKSDIRNVLVKVPLPLEVEGIQKNVQVIRY